MRLHAHYIYIPAYLSHYVLITKIFGKKLWYYNIVINNEIAHLLHNIQT